MTVVDVNTHGQADGFSTVFTSSLDVDICMVSVTHLKAKGPFSHTGNSILPHPPWIPTGVILP